MPPESPHLLFLNQSGFQLESCVNCNSAMVQRPAQTWDSRKQFLQLHKTLSEIGLVTYGLNKHLRFDYT